jgi:7-cyano-7-deazaguanine synthase in queuosine biosynthesis
MNCVFELKKEKIKRLMAKNGADDLEVLLGIERILEKKRGYVFKMPKKGTPVIALMSGGLDTTVMISILLKEYGLKVYPVYFNRNLRNSLPALRSIKYFTKYFKRKYPGQFCKPLIFDCKIPLEEIGEDLENVQWHCIDKKIGRQKGIPMQPSFYANHCLLYSKYLEEKEKEKIRNIFGAWYPDGSKRFIYESLTSFRSIMLGLCCQDNDFSWQFTSLPMEKELGFWFGKEEMIKIGTKHEIPMEKSWTCFFDGGIDGRQCGRCDACYHRKDAFNKAGVRENYKYRNEMFYSELAIKLFVKKYFLGR